jgi:hypothetical protein
VGAGGLQELATIEASLSLRVFMVKTELVDAHGDHLRYVPGALARAMVNAGAAEVSNANGKVKAIRLVECARTHARLIGPPTDGSKPPPFSVREKLDGGHVVWRHHARCTY